MSDYFPISCSLYDELESAATLRNPCNVVLCVDGETRSLTGRITDLYSRHGVEYLLLDGLVEIRLDGIHYVNGISFGGE
ncbi:MAG: hypothetical protein O3B73_04970 [bacterium]|jgi:transcriptional antiterminator Rof (Rho-off)|nr:hypothetical protein [bacterium]